MSYRRRLERKELEEELERYRLIVESLPDGIFTFDLKGNITSVNNVVLRYGYKKEGVIGKSLLEFIPEKDWPMISKHLANLAKGNFTQGEVELKTKKGIVTTEFRSSPIKKRGKIVGFQSIVRDVTKRKKMEAVIKRRLEFEKTTSAISSRFVGVSDIDEAINASLADMGILSVASRVYLFLFSEDRTTVSNTHEWCAKGVSPQIDNLQNLPCEMFPWWMKKLRKDKVIHIQDVSKMPAEAKAKKESLERQHIKSLLALPVHTGGELAGYIGFDNVMETGKWSDDDSALLRVSSEIIGNAIERKKAEEQIIESEERLRQLIEYAPEAIYINDLNANFLDGNKQAEKMTGYKKEELIGKNMLDVGLFPEKYIPKAMEALEKNWREQKTGPDEFELIRKDGSMVTVEISTFPVKREGKVEVISIARDITERKAMEKKLVEYSQHLEKMVEKRTREFKESEEKLKDLFKTIPDSIAIVDLNGNMLEFNETTLALFGYPREEIIGKNVFDFVAEEDLERTAWSFKQTLEEGFVRVQFLVLAKGGRKIPVELNASILKDVKGTLVGFVAVLRDITERRKMEEQLLKSERLAAIGQLATMVGHDLRNPLSSIQNASYYLKMKLGTSKDEKVKKMFRIIDNEINYANNIVKDLLDFSRINKPELKKVDLISSIQDALAQLEFPENITLTPKYSKIPTIEADPNQLRRIFQNIALNGMQAMPNGGELTVSTRKNGDFVEAAFTDTGVGIPKENMEKLFTPLFTTKAQGVGLGLAICKNLVESHNGKIEVKSKVGEGSTFTVKLPIHRTEGGENQT